MRVIRRLAFLVLVLLLLPTVASARADARREALPRLEATRVWQILTRPWVLLWKVPEPAVNKGGGMMDPNGIPLPCDDSTATVEGEGGGMMDPNG